MKLNEESIANLLKNTTEVVVFGLGSCGYGAVSEALSALRYHVHSADNFRLPVSIPFSPGRCSQDEFDKRLIAAQCKNDILNLIFENYKRAREGKVIIPLLFCMSIENDVEHQAFDLASLFITNSSISNKELRRCYRLYAETTPEIQKIVLETIKFVHVKQHPDEQEQYLLEQVPPFWEKKEFQQKWQVRVSEPNRFSQLSAFFNPKQYQWKTELLAAIRLFDPGSVAVNAPDVDNRPGLRSKL